MKCPAKIERPNVTKSEEDEGRKSEKYLPTTKTSPAWVGPLSRCGGALHLTQSSTSHLYYGSELETVLGSSLIR